MQVKEAVSAAKTYIADLFSGEGARNVGLEEVEFDPAAGVWCITVGFSRPSDDDPAIDSPLAAVLRGRQFKKTYKVVRISNDKGDVLSVKNREVPE